MVGCGFHGRGNNEPFDAAIDGAVDAVVSLEVIVDGPPLCATWMPRNITDLCTRPAATPGELVIDSAVTYDTDSGVFGGGGILSPPSFVQDQTFGAELVQARVMVVESIRITATGVVTVTGTKPLIILASDAITIDGTLDAAGHGTGAGPGANMVPCKNHSASNGTSDPGGGGSGGGGGGGRRGHGGRGGPGDDDTPNPGGAGGTEGVTPTVIAGGCSGAPSGQAGPTAVTHGVAADTQTSGGGAGGGVQLSAYVSIAIGGIVTVGGGGGAGAILNSANGGGGGGSGGIIALDTPTISGNGKLAANGGGGGSGGPFSAAGNPGTNAGVTGAAAPGGPSVDVCSPAGAMGAAGSSADGTDASQNTVACGGGGGGGATGYIIVYGSASVGGMSVSPSVTMLP